MKASSRVGVMGLSLLACTGPALAAEVVKESSVGESGIEEVVITSRNRAESAQDVPIPVTVIGASSLERDGTVALQDLVKQAPGLQATTPNSRRTGISLRGIGKSAGNDALEASMGVIVDGVFLSHPGMTYLDFTDLDRIEVLRGPQGTLLGKNTTIGAINYVTRKPDFQSETSAHVGLGERDGRTANLSYGNSIIDEKLAFRASGFLDRQDGYITNVNAVGGTTSEKNRSGGRLQFLLTPLENISLRLNADYSQTSERSNTKPVIAVLARFDDATQSARVTTPGGTGVPTDANQVRVQNTGIGTYASVFDRAWFGGYKPIVGSWSLEDLNLNVPVQTSNQGASANLDWEFGRSTLTLISAFRRFSFDAKNDADQTKFDTGRNGSRVDAGQSSHELRVTSAAGDAIDYQAGLYYLHNWNTSTGRSLYGEDSGAFSSRNGDYNALYGSAAGNALLRRSLNQVYVASTITPETKSYAGFGQANWKFTDRATLTVGVRETYEEKTSSSTRTGSFFSGAALDDLGAVGAALGATPLQIASARNIRSTTIGTTFATVQGAPIKAWALSWLVSPTYKLSDDVLLYSSVASGQKSGSVQFTNAGAPQNVAPEKVLDVELGIKSLLLNRRLQLNANLFQTRVHDYQQTTSIFDATTTALRNDGTLYYSSVLGNIPGIRARGLEVEGRFEVARSLKLTFGGNFNDATYTDWHTATCASELNVRSATTVCDNTGRQIVAAPRLTATFGVDYARPVAFNLGGHFWVNNVYRAAQNFDNNLSRYGVQGGYYVLDAGIGVTTADDRIEVDLIAKNALNRRYTTSVNVGSDGSIGYDGIGDPRWLGLVLHARF